jgi:hypothetical protein
MLIVVSDVLADRLDAAARAATQAADAIRSIALARDWLDQLDIDGDALKSDEAAYIGGVHPDTMRRRAESAALAGRPIGILLAGAIWLFSERRLLDAIESRDGRPARLVAESRAKKSREMRSRSDICGPIPTATAI